MPAITLSAVTPERKPSPPKGHTSPRDDPGQETPVKITRGLAAEVAAEAAVEAAMEGMPTLTTKASTSGTAAAANPAAAISTMWAGPSELLPETALPGWPSPMDFVLPPPGLAMDFASPQQDFWQTGAPLLLPTPHTSFCPSTMPGGDGSNVAAVQDFMAAASGIAAAQSTRTQNGAPAPAAIAPESASEKKPSRAAAIRMKRIVQILEEMLSSKEIQVWMDREGYVSIARLLRGRQDLQRDAFGSTRVIAQAVDAQLSGSVRLDQERRRVRRQTTDELICSVAERDISSAPHGSVPLQRIVAAKALQPVLNVDDKEGVVRRALEHEESQVMLHNGWVYKRPRGTQLRRLAEELFSEAHLSQDARLRGKIADSQSGEVPLTWLCSRYVHKMSADPMGGARAAEVSAVELCQALKNSEVLIVDERKLTLRRRVVPMVQDVGNVEGVGEKESTGDSRKAPVPARPMGKALPTATDAAQAAPSEKRAGTARAASQLRQLLDFYFEPFTFQHNRYLLDLLARRVGPPKEAGPWVPEVLYNFHFTFADLAGLGRIAAAVGKLYPSIGGDVSASLGQLKYVRFSEEGKMQFRLPPEVRSFVPAAGAQRQDAEAVARYLTAAREQRGQAPGGMLSVLSYAVAGPLQDHTDNGHHRCSRLKRQLLVHHADFVFLQGLDGEGTGAGLAATLSEEGYAFACARQNGEANSIFWDRSRWELVATEELGAVLAVDLRPFEEPSTPVRAICMRPTVPMTRTSPQLRQLFAGPLREASGEGPLLVCADLTLVGGAEGASILEELAGLPSVMQEILGEELLVPSASPCLPGQCPQPKIAAASGLNKLHSPDAVLFRGMQPTVALSGHTEGYLATMSAEDVLQQFPAFRMPIVAAFDRRAGYEPDGSVVRKPGIDIVRI